MATEYTESKYYEKRAFPFNEIPIFLVDLIHAINKIKSVETVQNVYINVSDDKLEIYIFYQTENFDIEDKINKYLLDWERDYAYFPEVFIYPLNMISSQNEVLPKTAVEI